MRELGGFWEGRVPLSQGGCRGEDGPLLPGWPAREWGRGCTARTGLPVLGGNESSRPKPVGVGGSLLRQPVAFLRTPQVWVPRKAGGNRPRGQAGEKRPLGGLSPQLLPRSECASFGRFFKPKYGDIIFGLSLIPVINSSSISRHPLPSQDQNTWDLFNPKAIPGPCVCLWDVLVVHSLPWTPSGPVLGSKVASKGLSVVRLSLRIWLDTQKPGP